MIIDIIIAIIALLAIVTGWRKGFITQLLQLVGLYIAILAAPELAEEVGPIFTTDPGLAYLVGFGVVVLGAMVLIWIVAPLFRKLLFFEALRTFDSLLGTALAIVATTVVLSVACSLISTANIGDMRPDKVLELGANGLSADMIEDYAERLERRDAEVREYFEPKYIDYAVLDESILFNELAALGNIICPELRDIEEDVMEWAIRVKTSYATIK